MKPSPSLLSLVSLLLIGAHHADASVVAYWNFNALTTSTNNGTTYTPTSGSGSLALAGWTSAATTGITAFGGSTTNALNSDVAGQSLALQGGTTSGTPNNGATLLLTVNLTGLENPVLSFATQRTSTGFNSNQVAYSTDGSNFTNFGSAYVPAASFGTTPVSFDFSTINALDNASAVYLRITFTGATATAGNNRIDNIQINAAQIIAVPEPNVAALFGAVGVLGLLRRRRY